MKAQALILVAAVAAALAVAAPGYADTDPSPETAKVDAGGVLEVDGNTTDEHIALRLKAGDPATVQVDFGDDGTAEFSFARADVIAIDLDARAGDDVVRIDDSHGDVEGTTPTTINGGHGNDTVTGGAGAETLIGDTDNDVVDGNGGDDTVQAGDNDDTVVWNFGDGNDTIDGEGGADTLEFDGGGAAEQIGLSARGGHLRLTRDVGAVTLDADGVETVDVAPNKGADTVTVDLLGATDVGQVTVDDGTPDGADDDVVVNGTGSADTIAVGGDPTAPAVTGLAVPVSVLRTEIHDRITVNGLGGADTISAATLPPLTSVTLNGGGDPDTLTGGGLFDTISGGQGIDTAVLGGGQSTFVWAAGDGNDTIDGGLGSDTLQVSGTDSAERFELSNNGGRLSLTRDVGTVTLDAGGIESVDLDAAGGADTITVDDLTGTGVEKVAADLGAGDKRSDQVIVNATGGDDVVAATGDAKNVTVLETAAQIEIFNTEPTDSLTMNGRDGNDTIEGALPATAISLVINGGDGEDVLIGSDGDDVISGGPKDDVIIGHGGIDTIDGGPGNDTIFP